MTLSMVHGTVASVALRSAEAFALNTKCHSLVLTLSSFFLRKVKNGEFRDSSAFDGSARQQASFDWPLQSFPKPYP